MKKIIWGLSFLIVLVIGIFIYYVTTDLSSVMEKQEQKASVTKIASVADQEEKKISAESSNETNPFDDSIAMDELNDSQYQKYIHGMSHQKVKASEKWGFYLITEERIQWLLEGLEVANVTYGNVYKEILERWAEGDFSIVDEDHNTIWRMQDGNIGKATGILSPAEEKAYIESHQ